MRKLILSSILSTTFLVNTSYAQNFIVPPLPVEVVSELRDMDVSNGEFLERVKRYLVQYPEQVFLIENIVRVNRPNLLSEVINFIADKQLHKSINISNRTDMIVSPRDVVGVENATGSGVGLIGLGAVAAGVAAFALGGDKGVNNPPAPPETPPVVPVDPLTFVTDEFQSSYALGLIGAHNYYAEKQTSGQGVKVAVVDSGVDITHADLIDNIDVENSFSYRTGDNNVQDLNGHGTHVAGIIAGMKNDTGIQGLAYNSQIVAYEFLLNPDGDVSVAPDFSNLMSRVESSGARVMNNSWGYSSADGDSILVTDFIDENDFLGYLGGDAVLTALGDYILNVDGVLVWSTGNDGVSEVGMMAGLPFWIPEAEGSWVAVGSINENEQISTSSNRCGVSANWCLVAPGENIVSTWSKDGTEPNFTVSDDGQYALGGGTSMAAPFVSGAIALLMEEHPELDSSEILTILFDTAKDLGDPGVDAVYGRGMLSLGDALAPQGTLNIQMSNSTFGEQFSARSSGFVASSVIGESLKDVADNYSISLTDKYNRGFDVNLAGFMSTHSINESRNHDISYKLNKINFREGGENILLDNESIQFSLGDNPFSSARSANLKLGSDSFTTLVSVNSSGDYGTYEEKGFVNNDGFGVAHLGLINTSDMNVQQSFRLTDNISMNAKYVVGDTVLGDSRSDTHSGLVGLAFEMGGVSNLNLNIGNMKENGSILGGVGFGAFNTVDTDSKTDFIQFGGEFGIADSASLLFSASLGETSFNGAGLISGGNMQTQSYSFGYKTSSVFSTNDSLTLGISQPLSVISGRVNMNLPVGRSASSNGMSSHGVIRDNVGIDLNGKTLTQLEIGYNKSINEESSFSFGSVYSSELGATASMKVSINF